MKSLKLFALGLIATSLTACDPIEGILQVTKSFSAIAGTTNNTCNGDDYPCTNPTESVQIPEGSHKVKLDVVGRDTLQMRIKVGRWEKNIELNLPRGTEIPDTGRFSLPGRDSGQPFDLNGETLTQVSTGPEMRDRESCQVPVQEQVCGVIGNPPQAACWWETRYRQGWQDVQYYLKTTDQSLNAQIVQNGTEAATLKGSRSSSQKIYTYRGYCSAYY